MTRVLGIILGGGHRLRRQEPRKRIIEQYLILDTLGYNSANLGKRGPLVWRWFGAGFAALLRTTTYKILRQRNSLSSQDQNQDSRN